MNVGRVLAILMKIKAKQSKAMVARLLEMRFPRTKGWRERFDHSRYRKQVFDAMSKPEQEKLIEIDALHPNRMLYAQGPLLRQRRG